MASFRKLEPESGESDSEGRFTLRKLVRLSLSNLPFRKEKGNLLTLRNHVETSSQRATNPIT